MLKFQANSNCGAITYLYSISKCHFKSQCPQVTHNGNTLSISTGEKTTFFPVLLNIAHFLFEFLFSCKFRLTTAQRLPVKMVEHVMTSQMDFSARVLSDIMVRRAKRFTVTWTHSNENSNMLLELLTLKAW